MERRKDHFVFLICLILAASFWFLIKLSDVYPVSYSLKLKYTHIPKGKLLTSLKDSTVTIHFKSNGYNLLNLLLHRQLDSLTIDLSQSDTRIISNNEYSVQTASLRESTAQFLGVNDRELEFSKPMLVFNMEKLKKIRKKVIPQLELKFKSQFQLYGYHIKPSRITIYGPKNILDTLRNIKTRVIHLENLSGKRSVNVAVANPYPKMLRFYPSKVQVNLDVEKYTERSLKIPVDVSEIKPSIRTFPTETTIYFNVFIRDYEKIHARQFRVVPNVKNINLRTAKKLRLQLISSPGKISNIRLVPPEVEFIIIN